MFDDRIVPWIPFGDFTGFQVALYRAEPELGLAHFVAKFEPNSRIHLHRHVAETTTYVIDGELRVYEPDGTLSDVRPAGTYAVTPAGAPPHREGGGDEPCIVFYSFRSDQDLILEWLNDDFSLYAPLHVSDIAAAIEAQTAAASVS